MFPNQGVGRREFLRDNCQDFQDRLIVRVQTSPRSGATQSHASRGVMYTTSSGLAAKRVASQIGWRARAESHRLGVPWWPCGSGTR